MFQDFFYRLKSKNIPVSTTELMDLIKMTSYFSSNNGSLSLKEFYTVARSCLIKDIKYFDDYDLVFANTFGNTPISDDNFK